MKNTKLHNATNDEIIMSIHVLWERGWKVTPESTQEMLRLGSHAGASIPRIKHYLSTIPADVRTQWLRNFNWESPWVKEHGFPQKIDEGKYHHQEPVNDMSIQDLLKARRDNV